MHENIWLVLVVWTVLVIALITPGIGYNLLWLLGTGLIMAIPLGWTLVVAIARRRWRKKIVTATVEEDERAATYWARAIDAEAQVLGVLYLSSYLVAVNSLVSRLISGDGYFGLYLALLMVFAPIPPWITLVVAHSIKDKQGDQSLMRAAHTFLIGAFEPEYWYSKVFMMTEAAVFNTLTLAAPSAIASLISGEVASVLGLVVSMKCRPFLDDIEDYSDIVSRMATAVCVACGLLLQTTGINKTLIGAIAVLSIIAASL